MKPNTLGWSGGLALAVAHCAGMVDLVALPVWIGALIAQYKFAPQQAGLLVTLFLVGVVVSCLLVAPRLGRLNARLVAVIGFALAALAFAACAYQTTFPILAALHTTAGLAVGCALSVTHGTIARSVNPHRLFAIVNLALGFFAIFFLGATPNFIAQFGGQALFVAFAIVMVVATVVSTALFPAIVSESVATKVEKLAPLSKTVWFGIAGVCLMALNQAMIFSFVERIGIDRGFGLQFVTGVLIAIGIFNIIPAPLAAILERRVPVISVLVLGPIAQAVLALAITMSTGSTPYAIAAAVFVGVMIFTHTFAFGAMARIDTSGRAMAATPAMLMSGAAIGPVLAGTLVQNFGYYALGVASVVIASVAIMMFLQLRSATKHATA